MLGTAHASPYSRLTLSFGTPEPVRSDPSSAGSQRALLRCPGMSGVPKLGSMLQSLAIFAISHGLIIQSMNGNGAVKETRDL